MAVKKVTCIICRKTFWARGNRAKYCSPSCRKSANLLRVSNFKERKRGLGPYSLEAASSRRS